MRKERKYNYIYKTTCSITNRYYIGMHSTNKLDDGYLGSGKRLWFSINYYGKDNHIKEILEYCNSREELKKREEEIVNEQLLTEDLCMNLKTGGDGGFVNNEHRFKFIEGSKKTRHLGRERLDWLYENDEDWVKFMGEKIKEGHLKANHNYKTFLGKIHSDETKKKMSEIMKGKGVGSDNSQHGTCWIHCKGTGEVKKIKKEEWFSYTIKSDCIWEKGRK